MPSNPLTTSLRDLVTVLFKRKWSVLTILFVTTFAAAFYLFILRDDQYTAVAKVLIRVGHEYAPASTVINEQPTVIGYRNHDVNSEVDIVKSTDLVVQLVDELGLGLPEPPKPVPDGLLRKFKYYSKKYWKLIRQKINDVLVMVGLREKLEPREMAIEVVLSSLHVEALEESNTIVVALSSEARPYVATAVNELVDRYLKFRVKAFENKSAVTFFQNEETAARERLTQAEKALDEFEQKWNIVSIENQKASLIEDLSQARQRVEAAKIEYETASQKVARLESEVVNVEDADFGALGEFLQQTFPSTLLDRLTTLQLERQMLAVTEQPDSPRMKVNQEQFDGIINVLGSNVRAVQAEKKGAFDLATAEYERLSKELEVLHAHEMEWRTLTRDASAFQDTLMFFRKKAEDAAAKVARDEQTIGSASVIQRAITPLMPSGIRKTYLFLAAVAGAIFAALAWASICEYFDHRVWASEVLEEHLGSPVLGTIPRDRTIGSSA